MGCNSKKLWFYPHHGKDSPINQSVHTGSWPYPFCYLVGIRSSFLKGEMAIARSWPLTPPTPTPSSAKLRMRRPTPPLPFMNGMLRKNFTHTLLYFTLLYTLHFLLRCFKMNIQVCPTVHIPWNTWHMFSRQLSMLYHKWNYVNTNNCCNCVWATLHKNTNNLKQNVSCKVIKFQLKLLQKLKVPH
jgi:hypothetical protein